MNTLYKHLHTAILIPATLLTTYVASAQTPEQAANWEFDNTVTGNHIYEARDYIKLKPGFSFTPMVDDSHSPVEIDALVLRLNESITSNVENNDLSYDPDNYQVNTALPVGAINSVFDVTSAGSAAYSIPIDLPPGTAGMIPKISINYNSSQRDGLLGVGWDLAAYSAISRCGQNMYNDNNTLTS
ncbi:MAG: SpvB/TcaC N-terminal domain-containing protein [Bacteroidales bacterium]